MKWSTKFVSTQKREVPRVWLIRKPILEGMGFKDVFEVWNPNIQERQQSHARSTAILHTRSNADLSWRGIGVRKRKENTVGDGHLPTCQRLHESPWNTHLREQIIKVEMRDTTKRIKLAWDGRILSKQQTILWTQMPLSPKQKPCTLCTIKPAASS